jgi:predicted HTH transcriptional regulator
MIGLHYRNRRIGDFLKELDLVEGRNTGVPVAVNVMRENGSPPPVFSTPENRDWLSVTLPVNPHFCETEKPIPQKTALEIAPESGRIAPETGLEVALEKSAKEPASDEISRDNNHIVSVVTAEEELEQIELALKIALEIAPETGMVQNAKQKTGRILERRARIIQHILRDKQITIFNLSELLATSIRTLKSDMVLLQDIGVLKRIGANKKGSWVVLLDEIGSTDHTDTIVKKGTKK